MPMDRAIHRLLAAILLATSFVGFLRADEAGDQYAVAAGHYAAERWQLACDEFQVFLTDHPQHEKTPQARFYLAESLVQLGKPDEARRLFAELLEHNADSALARRALFRRGEASFLAGNDEQARRDLEAFHAQYPDDELAAYVLPYLGELALRSGETAKAIKFYDAATSRYPQGPLAEECRFGIARAEEQLGHVDKAQQEYEELAKDVYAPLADKAQLQLAILHNTAGRYAEALTLLETFGERFKDSQLTPQVELARGWSLYKLERYASAETVFGRLIDKPEWAVEAHYWQGMIRASQQQWKSATEEFQSAARGATDHRLQPALAFQTGEAFRQLGEWDRAAEQFDKLLAQWPDDAFADNALFAKMQVALRKEDYDVALALAKDFLERFGESSLGVAAECRSTLAACHARKGQLAEARQALGELIAKDPKSELIAPTTYQVAEAAFQSGDQATAKELFTTLTGQGNSADWVGRGLAGVAWAQLKEEDLAGSASTFEKLLQQNPKDALAPTAALIRGQALEKLGQAEPALAMYRRVIEEYAQSRELPQAMFRAALIYDKLDRKTEAAALYRKLLDEHPKFSDRAAVLYQFGCLEAEERHGDEATRLWQCVRAEHAASSVWCDATYRLALAALEARKFDECEKLLAECTSKSPADHLRPHVLYLQGRLAAAREQWDHVASPLDKLITDFPGHALISTAAYWIAEAEYRQNDFQAATDHFAKLESQATQADPWAPMASLRRSQCLVQLGKGTEALEIARKIESTYPSFASQYEVDYLIGRCLANDADFAAAREAYAKVIRSDLGGKTETAAMAQWMIGESYFHQEDYAAALKAYLRVEILYAYPRWQAAALLQAGKCHERLGEWKQSADMYSKLIKNYPDCDATEEAVKRLGIAQQNLEKQRS